MLKFKDKSNIAILTNFQAFNPGYSLTGIVVDQALMLLEHGHKVFIFVNENFNKENNKDSGLEYIINRFPDTFQILKKTKFMHLVDYQSKEEISKEHEKQAVEAGVTFATEILSNNIDVIYTHDFIFTGWNLPYSIAIKEANKIVNNVGQKKLWLHWIHSVPLPHNARDWWYIKDYSVNNFIVFPNKTDSRTVAEAFRTNDNFVRIIPHIKDIRTWYDFSEDTREFIRSHPNMLQAQITKVYPVSTDRLSAKQLHLVIRIFGHIKKTDSVFLCIANQWATGRQRKESVERYIELGEYVGLEYGKDFAFTSEYIPENIGGKKFVEGIKGSQSFKEVTGLFEDLYLKNKYDRRKTDIRLDEIVEKYDLEENFLDEKEKFLREFTPYATGINRRMLRELQLLSNVFIFPTKEESFGLVGPEASFSGCLCVTNRSLDNQSEVMGNNTVTFDFGSYRNNVPQRNEDGYIKAISSAILNRIYSSEAIMTKMYTRIRYNSESIYDRFYVPFAT